MSPTQASCEYTTGRKDRLKIATDQNAELIELLKDLSLRACDDDKQAIRNALREVTSDNIIVDTSPAYINEYGKRAKTDVDASPRFEVDAEKRRFAESAGFDDVPQQDLQKEDLLRSLESRATGYVGSNSDVQWFRSLRSQFKDPQGEDAFDAYFTALDPPLKGPWNRTSPRQTKLDDVLPVTNTTYYLDSDSIDVDGTVDAYVLPPADIAEKLFESYQTVHSSFPVLPKSFEDQFHQCYDALRRSQLFRVKDKWRAILNLVFAIGARYSHLIAAEWQADSLDHFKYMSRALRLLEGHTIATLVAHPDLLSIQATSLLSIYYLAIGHVSRAWITIGSAIRFALTVGLHLRNDDPQASLHRKETLARIWWGLHSVESLLSAITGRPDVISDNSCTVPLPTLLLEEQSTESSLRRSSEAMHPSVPLPSASPTSPLSPESKPSTPVRPIPGSFLDARVRISRLTQKVLLTLYSPRATSRPWEQIQNSVSELMVELEEWAFVAMPDKVSDLKRTSESDHQRDQMLLGFHYYSTKLLVTRPCLCRIEYRQQGPTNESTVFDRRTAGACVQAAKAMCTLLPDQPDPKYMYRNGPWWSLVHHIMQALAVLLLEMSYRGTYEQEDSKDLFDYVHKLILWLHSMRSTNPIADRAFSVVSDIVKKGDPSSFGVIARRLPSSNPVPSTDAATHFSHPYLQSNPAVPTEPTPRFQPNEFDPIEWQYLDAEPQQMQRTTPFTMSPIQQQAGVFAPNTMLNPVFMPSNSSSPTTNYGNPFPTGFNRPSTTFKGGDGGSSL
ncbi:fungal-specific transcription factor domain-containing protein [Lophiotrema nucula]|uniref:Fungal-specific transcription factor domain-containing protein n=1 Tax=Lophiotrema nucula TaxID=690887 RepID=A0A6A5YKU1_9PLEO|nr:fungal-specific transcription factor domain-containing protein [Lophiotrema nucula]